MTIGKAKSVITISALMFTFGIPAASADHHGDDHTQDKGNNVKKVFPVKDGEKNATSGTVRKESKQSGKKTNADGSVKSGGSTDSSTIGKGTGSPESTTSGSGTGYSGYRDKD